MPDPADLLDRALARDPSRPFLTWYDDASGERLELSVATFANWVAKTAGMVTDGFGLGPDDVVRLDLPRHWQRSVWAVAAWRAGCTVALGTASPPAGRSALWVRGPRGASDERDERDEPDAADVVAVSLLPLGAPFRPGTVPPGAVDYAVEVPAYADRLSAARTATSGTAVLVSADGGSLGPEELRRRAAALADRWGLTERGRLLVASPLGEVDDVLATTLVPLVVDGSVVVCAPPGEAPSSRGGAERVTATAS